MSVHASPPSITTSGPADAALSELAALLDDALAKARRATGRPAMVAMVEDGRPRQIRADPPIPDTIVSAVCQQMAAADDGAVCIEGSTAPPGWTGRRYGIGADRSVSVLVAGSALDEPAAVRLEAIALEAARVALLEEERRRSDQLNQLLATARQVAESLELETVLSSIVRDATTLLGADSGDMLLWDREHDLLRVVAVSNFPPEMLGFELAFGEGLSSQAILAQRTIGVDDYGTYEHRAPALDRYAFGAVLCAPLVFRGVAIGAINVHTRAGRIGFPAGGPQLLAAFAGQAAIAIDHARRYENEVRLGRDLAETNRELTRSLTVQQLLAEQVLLDAGPAGIATVLAEHLGRRIVIQDHLHRSMAGASPDGSDDWHGLGALPGAPGAPGEPSPGRDPFTIAVRVGTEVVGHLLLSSDEDLGPIDRALVDVATTGVALEFAKERAAAEVEERLRGEAVTDLLGGTYPSEAAIALRTARLGYDLAEPRDLMVIDVQLEGADRPASAGADPDRIRRLLQVARERLTARAPRSLAVLHGGLIVILAGAGRTPARDLRTLADELRASLEAVPGVAAATVAISDRCSRPDDYAPAFRLARDAVELLLKLGRRGAVVSTAELGPYGILLRASDRDELEAFAIRSVRPLVDHDRAHGGELLSTLRAYIEEDRVQRRVASRCFIHVNTVVYRVRRIEELLGIDLGDPSVIFDLTLALRILDLLGDPPSAGELAPHPTTVSAPPQARHTSGPAGPRSP
ncbi:MAG TPA: helix-turn-helix domain-containing protein [Candidatus Limnocylindrales bacterium]|nr:helix-turn-helix domain-containing protein [Candidatus Limnocylindrales bacterium]